MVRLRQANLLLAAVLMASCGGTPASPSGSDFQITAISPSSGSTFGGTDVTISGRNLDGDTRVSFGGAAAVDVSVLNPDTISARTPAHPAGAVDVVVTKRATSSQVLRAGYTFVVPAPRNAVYGFRTAYTRSSDVAWYHATRVAGLALVASGVFGLLAMLVPTALTPASSARWTWLLGFGSLLSAVAVSFWLVSRRR